MADVTVDAAVGWHLEVCADRLGPVWTSATVGYVFFINGADTEAQYRKTTNGGDTWSAATAVVSDSSVLRVTIWYDRWTPGDSGTKIHVWVYGWSNDRWYYRSLDTSSDTLGTQVDASPGEADGGANGNLTTMVQSATKARNGYLYFAYQNSAGGGWRRSTDSGATWTSRTTPFESSVRDPILAIPATTSDNADAALIFWDASADELSVKLYDDSANTWTETSIATSMVESGDYLQMASSIRHSDGHVIVAAWTALDSATADLRVWDLTLDSIATPTVTAKTNVLTDTVEGAQAAVQIDQNTDNLYVAYLRGTAWGSDVHARYKISTDDGTSWGSEQTSSVTNSNHLGIWTDLSTATGAGGLFAPVWLNATLDDLVTNSDNAVALGAVSRSLDGALPAPTGVLAGSTGGIPQFVAAGTAAWTATNAATIAPGLPSGWAADDIHVLIAHRSDNTAMTSLVGSGWTNIAGLTGNNTAAQRVEVWWRRAVGGDAAPTVTFGSGTVVRGARIIGIRGCVTSGDPFSTSSRSDNAASATLTFATITPTDANTRLIALYAYEDDPTAASTITNWQPFVITTSSLGNDAAIGFALKQWPTASSATGGLTSTASGGTFTNSPNVGILVSLKPAVTVVTRTPSGDMPASSGALTRQLAALRTLTGSHPASTGVLSRTAGAFARAVVGSLPFQTGALTRIYQALRTLAGNQPAATGALSRIYQALRALTGDHPASTGTLTRLYQALRAFTGDHPASTGALSRTAGAFARTAAGDMPASTGVLSRLLAALRTLTGSMPTATGVLGYSQGLISRTLAGALPEATGTLSRRLAALRTVVGDMPASGGVLARTAAAFARSLTGSPAAATGVLTRTAGAFARTLAGALPEATGILEAALSLIYRTLAGSLPEATGALTRRLAALRTATGDMPAASGALSRTAGAFARVVAGSPAAATGAVVRIKQAVRALVGAMPTATGTLSSVSILLRSLVGSLPAATGALSRQVSAFRSLAGSMESAAGVLARTGAAFARALAGAMAAATGLLTRTHSSETTAVAGSATDAAYGAAVAADSLYVAATAADTALVGATASDSEG